MFKKFGKNVKKYVDYLMSVDFKELFINTGIIICIVVLALLTSIPMAVVQDLFKSIYLVVIGPFEGVASQVFNIIFYVFSIIIVAVSFIYLFNKRLEDIDEFKEQFKKNKTKKNNNKEDDEFDLPKAKDNK